MAFNRRPDVDVIEQFIDGTDFAILADEVPAASWWRRFPFHRRGIEVRGDPTELPGWSNAEPFLRRIEYFSVRSGRSVDLSFLPQMTSVKLLAVPASTTTVDVSGLPVRWFEGQGVGLKGIFDLTTLRTLHLRQHFPNANITSPVKELALWQFNGELTFSNFAHQGSIQSVFVDRSRSVDVTSLGSLRSLQELTLWACARVDGIGALTQVKSLRKLKILDCPIVDEVSMLRHLDGVQIFVGGSNAFSYSLRETLRDIDRADWSFPDVAPTTPGMRNFLLHPGLPQQFVPLGPDDSHGPGENLSNEWESLSEKDQRSLLITFADRLAHWLTQQGVDHVVEGATGSRQPFSADAIRHLVDSTDSLDLSFVKGDFLVAKIVESIWLGAVVTSADQPSPLRSIL